jgi:hypothetical protein
VVEKDADAEAIFWEMFVDQQSSKTSVSHYIRIKIFTERGTTTQGTVELPYLMDNKIEDISGRTIKPDGTIVELKPEAVFDRDLVRAGKFKFKAKTFAMPAVEPGAIIEYRWRQTYKRPFLVRIDLQRDVPIQLVKYYIKPVSSRFLTMRNITFNGQDAPLIRENDKTYSRTIKSVPAFRAEPRMPPPDQVRIWSLVYYQSQFSGFFNLVGAVHEEFKSSLKLNDELRRAAKTIIGDTADSGRKLELLFEFCKTKIKNVDYVASGMSAEEIERMKENKSPSDTLKRGVGTGSDINQLFAALASAAGFEARLAMLPDRGNSFFDPSTFQSSRDPAVLLYFMDSTNIAVRVDNKWLFFDPASTYVPHGMLRWQEEWVKALVVDPLETLYVPTPLSPHQKSSIKRSARLRLTEDGAIEGDVRVEETGHPMVDSKLEYAGLSVEEQEKTLRERITARLSGAEINDVRIENATDPIKPFVYTYRVRMHGYAQRTGKRLFLQPAFFQKGKKTLFAASERKHQVYFEYPWSEEDAVTIDLPAGYALDNAEAPSPIKAGTVSEYDVRINVVDDRSLRYKRSFYFGRDNALVFTVDQYPILKQLFDGLYERDNHILALRQP